MCYDDGSDGCHGRGKTEAAGMSFFDRRHHGRRKRLAIHVVGGINSSRRNCFRHRGDEAAPMSGVDQSSDDDEEKKSGHGTTKNPNTNRSILRLCEGSETHTPFLGFPSTSHCPAHEQAFLIVD
ncbi:hypothetical protein ACLOJK_012760 [Asimina triloba]